MPYFKNNETNILLIHIPKTGGTSLENYFSSKFNIELNNSSLYLFLDEKTKEKNNIIIKSSLQHLTYSEIVKYNNIFNINFNNIKILTIVRNPYEKIVSDLFWYKLIDNNNSKNQVYDIIKNYVNSSEYDNHNLPQHIFLSDDNGQIIQDINILHTETLTDDMKKLGYEDFNLCSNKNNLKDKSYLEYLNDESINIINNFYHNDFVSFQYDKINIQ